MLQDQNCKHIKKNYFEGTEESSGTPNEGKHWHDEGNEGNTQQKCKMCIRNSCFLKARAT